MNKGQLRDKLKAERDALPSTLVLLKSQQVAELLLDNTEWPAVKNLHIYESVPAWNEIDTSRIISEIRRTWPRIKLAVQSAHVGAPAPKGKFDLVVAPVLGFDKDGYRLGLGEGWYDRFLATQSQALKVGLAYSDSKIEGLPHQPHDIRLDKIITEDGILSCT